MKANILGIYRTLLCLFGWLIPTAIIAQEWDDKILITQCSDTYD